MLREEKSHQRECGAGTRTQTACSGARAEPCALGWKPHVAQTSAIHVPRPDLSLSQDPPSYFSLIPLTSQ